MGTDGLRWLELGAGPEGARRFRARVSRRKRGVDRLLVATTLVGALVWLLPRTPASIATFVYLLALPIAVAAAFALHHAILDVAGGAELALSSRRFAFRHAPLPWRGAIDAPVDYLDRFQGVLRAGRPELQVQTRDGQIFPILFELDRLAQAEFIAARLNRALSDLRAPRTYRG